MVMGDQFGCCFVPGRPTYIWGGVAFGMTRETFDRLVYLGKLLSEDTCECAQLLSGVESYTSQACPLIQML